MVPCEHFAQRLTQLVFFIVQGKRKNTKHNTRPAPVFSGKVASMKNVIELVFARRVMVN